MKKLFLAILLALILVNAYPVFASSHIEITSDNDLGETQLVYSVSERYLVLIPEAFELKQQEEVVRTVSAEDVCIGYGTELQIKISGANCSEDKLWYIVDETPGNESNKYEYSIGLATGLENVENESVILAVQAGASEVNSQDLFFNLKDVVSIAGVYSDTLTFSVSVE